MKFCFNVTQIRCKQQTQTSHLMSVEIFDAQFTTPALSVNLLISSQDNRHLLPLFVKNSFSKLHFHSNFYFLRKNSNIRTSKVSNQRQAMKVKKSDKSSSKENENIFSVEKILDKKIKKGKTFYFIKWFNYSDNHSSWEPEKNVQLYPGLIEEYEEEMRENETKGEKMV